MHTALQEGGDNTPVNQIAAGHLDMAIQNLGIQEEHTYSCSPEELDASPGHTMAENGYFNVNDLPGLSVDVDETKAGTTHLIVMAKPRSSRARD